MKILIIAFFILFSHFGFAQAAGKSAKVLHGKIAVDGAAIYASPDFDSEVIDYLNQGTVVPMTAKQFSGPSGLGLFHKVKTPGGKIGYVTDTDVQSMAPPGGKEAKPEHDASRKDESDRRRKDEEERRRTDEVDDEAQKAKTKPIYLTRWMGASLGMVDYTEKFSGSHLSEEDPFLGARLTGPGLFYKGMFPLDINIAFYPKPPTYLQKFGTGSATGFLAIGDFTFILPFTETKHSLWTYGIGLMWTFSDYKVSVAGQGYDSEDLRIGLDLDVGYGYRFGKNLVRADLKYYIEKSQYLSEIITYQREL